MAEAQDQAGSVHVELWHSGRPQSSARSRSAGPEGDRSHPASSSAVSKRTQGDRPAEWCERDAHVQQSTLNNCARELAEEGPDDGSGTGWRTQPGCSLCRPQRNADKQLLGYQHSLVLISVVGTGLSPPGDSEYAAEQCHLRRVAPQTPKDQSDS